MDIIMYGLLFIAGVGLLALFFCLFSVKAFHDTAERGEDQ